MSKMSFKNTVVKACRKKDEEDMKEGMVGKTKMEGLTNQDCKLKEYLKGKALHDVRDTFRVGGGDEVQLKELPQGKGHEVPGVHAGGGNIGGATK